MTQFVWLNESIKSNKQLAGPRGSYKRPIKFNVDRSTTILNPEKKYLISVEFFHLHKVRLRRLYI